MSDQIGLPWSEPTTSRDAAQRMAAKPEKVTRDRDRILECIRHHGPQTDGEIQARLHMSGNTERPRRGELVKIGALFWNGDKRNHSKVWEATRA